MPNYYEILGVRLNASQQEITKTYRELIKHYHPDRNPNSSQATIKAQAINEAYSVLKDPIKRYEYDNLLRLNTEPESTTQQESYTADEEAAAPSKVPHYECEICGRQDASLRVTVFLWVVSLFLVTQKKGWGKILCSRCRIKYSLLWNLEVWIAGWWGFPFGPIYSIEALYKNSKGGVQPEENNASLLAVLGYDFYLQGRYNDAYDALRQSQKIKAKKEKTEFLLYLRQYVKPKRPLSFTERLASLHPSFYNIPCLAALFIASYLLFFSLDWTFLSSSPSSSQYVPTLKNLPKEFEASTPYVKMASKFGINIEEIERSANACNQALANVASHIKSNVPYLGATYQSTITIHNYELDRDKLDDLIIHPNTELIFSEMQSTSRLIDKLRFGNSYPSSEVEESKAQLYAFLNSQHNSIVAAYFNCAILEYSIPTVNNFYSEGVLPDLYILKVFRLGKESDVKDWLNHTPYGQAYDRLISVISKIKKTKDRLYKVNSRVHILDAQIEDDKTALSSLERDLNYYEAVGLDDEYNNLVPLYNSRLSSAKSRIQEYNDLIEEHNQLMAFANDVDLDGSFNDCLDPKILFATFDRIDLHSDRRLRSFDQ